MQSVYRSICGARIGETFRVSKPLSVLVLASSVVKLRRATPEDLEAILGLIADDPLGQAREEAISVGELTPYRRAFATIDADPAQLVVVVVAVGEEKEVVGTMQLSFIPGLARRGALRAQIEAVRVHESYRSQGLGTAMLKWAIAEAQRRDCALVQLTTDKTRTDAHRFYDRLGFVTSHEGLKLRL